MWLEYCYETNIIQSDGFTESESAEKKFFASDAQIKLSSIDQITESEYLQVVEFNNQSRRLSFARDYLGFHPLLFATHQTKIIISDDIKTIIRWLKRQNVTPSLSEQALALYFVMGYVPQGHTLFKEITSCKNATIYQYERGEITERSVFTPIEIDPTFELADLKSQIMDVTTHLSSSAQKLDVWCSGGLDSSIIAYCAQKSHNKTELLSIDYPADFPEEYRYGELPYAQEVAEFYDLPLRCTTLSNSNYQQVYRDFISSFPMPVIDICIPPKYLLAQATNSLALTGEGGDPLFSGVKNNFMLYMQDRFPKQSLGWQYALSHKRFATIIEKFFTNGESLKAYTTDYFDKKIAQYPGDLTTKLFYLNTFEKQGGVIFLENYYAQKHYNIKIRHPLTALSVYQSTFKLSSEQRYRYPKGKLALINMFDQHLPSNIIQRKKSGTQVPLSHFVPNQMPALNETLLNTGFFSETGLKAINHNDTSLDENVLFKYAVMVLNDWITEQLRD